VLLVQFPLSLQNVENLMHERGIMVSVYTAATGGTGSGRRARPRSVGSGSTDRLGEMTAQGAFPSCSFRLKRF
jgi:hypothetical protein